MCRLTRGFQFGIKSDRIRIADQYQLTFRNVSCPLSIQIFCYFPKSKKSDYIIAHIRTGTCDCVKKFSTKKKGQECCINHAGYTEVSS